MSRAEGFEKKIAGKTKRFIGEVLGDQTLHEKGKEQERQGDKNIEEEGAAKPLGNLNKLT
jgi:uncharacterized protein YjbJ (UPF0337 family)